MEYEGAALVVSHDRYFVSRVANKIVELRNGELVLYRGDYAYYRDKKAEEAAADDAAAEAAVQEAKRKANREKQQGKKAAKTAARKASAA
jgi:ATP-binding cassette subfamily F protein 3